METSFTCRRSCFLCVSNTNFNNYMFLRERRRNVGSSQLPNKLEQHQIIPHNPRQPLRSRSPQKWSWVAAAQKLFFQLIFNIGNALSGAPLRKVIFQAGFPWASVGVSGRICSRLYAQIARIADLFETVRPDCNNNGSVRDCTLRLQQQRICSRL